MIFSKHSDPTIQKLYADAVQRTQVLLQQLGEAWDTGNMLLVKKLVGKLLSDRDLKFRAAVEIAKTKHKKLKRQPSPFQCYKLTWKLSLFEKPDEKIQLSFRGKDGGSVRSVINFGFRYRVAQRVLVLILSVIHRPKKYQYTHRGYKDAVLRAAELIEAGNVYFVHLDITKFYPSFTSSELGKKSALGNIINPKTLDIFVTGRRLSICEKVVQRHEKQFPYSLSHSMLRAVRRGIPTGSSLSSLIAPMMVSRMVLSQKVQDHLVNYEDNFLVVASCEQELDAMVKELEAAIGEIPGGQFSTHTKCAGKVTNDTAASFLGHAIYLNHNKVRIKVSAANEQRFYETLESMEVNVPTVRELKKGTKTMEAYSFTQVEAWVQQLAYIEAWRNAFSLADHVDYIATLHKDCIFADIEKHGVDLTKFDNAHSKYFDLNSHFDFSGMA